MVEGINAVAGSVVEVPDYSIPAEAPPSGELGKDAFLKLLVAQLKYQDPLEPSSSEEFIATTAQFTVVEKLDELTKQGANTALVNSLTTASALIGREVTVTRNGLPVAATVKQSRIVSGEVSLETDLGPVGLTEIVSVGPATAAPTPVAVPASTPIPAPAEVSASKETVVETAQAAPAPPEANLRTQPAPLDRTAPTPDEQPESVPVEPLQPAPVDQATDTPDEPFEVAPVLQPPVERAGPAPAAERPIDETLAPPIVEPAHRLDTL